MGQENNCQPKNLNSKQIESLTSFGFTDRDINKLDGRLQEIGGWLPGLNNRATRRLREWLIGKTKDATIKDRILKVRQRRQGRAFYRIEIETKQLIEGFFGKNR